MNHVYDLFLKHPEAERTTYCHHITRAFWLSGQMACGSVCLLIHGLVPALFEKTGTRMIRSLYQQIEVRVEHRECEKEDKNK